ncbi:hypothetical protein ACFQV8_27820 [Pseudonocardia benzenivorans]
MESATISCSSAAVGAGSCAARSATSRSDQYVPRATSPSGRTRSQLPGGSFSASL